MDKILTVLFALLILFMAWGFVVYQSADAVTIPTLQWTWEKKPLVCFNEPLDGEEMMIGSVAMGLWNHQFERIFGMNGTVGHRVNNATYVHPDCNVMVYYLDQAWSYDKDGVYDTVNGVAVCWTDNANDDVCPMYINTWNGTRNNRSLLITTLHEFGHIWGLGHEISNDDYERRNFPNGWTIMSESPQGVPVGVHNGLGDTIKCRYWEGSWEGFKKPCNFYNFYWNLV